MLDVDEMAAYESWKLFIITGFTLTQEGVALGIVQIELQSDHQQIIADLTLRLQQLLPAIRHLVAV